MKNVLIYYYNLYPENIHQQNNKYYFTYNLSNFILKPYEQTNQDLIDIYNMNIYLINQNIPIHQIIINKERKITTNINNKEYILLKLANKQKREITINDIIPFTQIIINPNNNIFKKQKNTSLHTTWSIKNDALIHQISHLQDKYPLIKESFNYFIALAETAIQILNQIDETKLIKVPTHTRIQNKIIDFYTPLNIIVDYRPRDPAEYFKKQFYKNKENLLNQIYTFISQINYTKEEHIVFFARMLYPTYYFDTYEQIIKEKIKQEEINNIIKEINNYELLIKKIYKYYRSTINIEIIEWLED